MLRNKNREVEYRMEKRELVCIGCPLGCPLTVELDGDEVVSVSGNTCKRGDVYARKAIMQYAQLKGIPNVTIDDIYIGNGVSELSNLCMSALLDDGDEVLIPSPDYPLWTACVTLAGGKAVHYVCDEQAEWYPDMDDIRKKVNERTKAIVIINPNNQTGSLYPKEVLQQIVDIARENQLMIFSDEIYEALNNIPGISVVKPKAAFYMFPKIDVKRFNITNDEKFALDLLHEKKILLIHGGGFNWKDPDHFRVVYLPRVEVLKDAVDKMTDFFSYYKQV